MKLYIDNQYPPTLAKILSALHRMQMQPEYEIVYRDWLDSFSSNDTVVFLVDFSKKGIDAKALDYFKDGFRVFVFRKPYGKPFDSFNQALIFLSQWKKILTTIKSEVTPFIYTISNAKKSIDRYKTN